MIISQGQIVFPSVKVANGQKLGTVITTEGLQLCGIMMPAAFTGANLTFYACSDATGANAQEIYNSAGVVTYAVAAGRFIAINPADFAGVQFLQIRSDTNEGADRLLLCSMKGF